MAGAHRPVPGEARRSRAAADVPLSALADDVRRTALAEQWFPDLRAPLRVEVVPLVERRRCSLHRIRLAGGEVQHDVLLKVRHAGGLTGGDGGGARSRPLLAPGLVLPESERAALELQGLQQAVAGVTADPSPAGRLAAVRPLLLLEEQAALVMDFVPWPTLRERLHAAHRGRRRRPDLPVVGAATGEWLRRLHAASPARPMRSRMTTGAEVAALVPRFADHLGRLRGERPLLVRLRRAGEVLARELPAALPAAVLHGDFAPRNVLVSPAAGVAVVDPMPTWRAAVHEDVARMLVGVRLTRLQLISGGLAIAAEELDGFERSFRRAYYGDDGPSLEIAAFGLLVALDQWSAQLVRTGPGTALLRRTSGVGVSWLERAVVGEVHRHLDAVECLTSCVPLARRAPAGPVAQARR